ncbi:trypsin-3-like [Pieris rapae]|uniref:trypsin-3-like n=1 Tax=Pieris rapae TaxID=64459 RepID=UPI001E27C09D|nr:trypsin-3-like [Pieris rapae]
MYGLSLSHHRPDLRIYGGKDADMKKFPFAVLMESAIYRKHKGVRKVEYAPFCSATALSSTWTLTASHCIGRKHVWLERELLFIRYNTTGEPQRKKILKIILSPNVNLNKDVMANDIGLVKTDSIELPSYAKLSSVDYTSLVGQEAIQLGYGNTHTSYEKDPGTNRTLKMMDVMLMKCGRIPISMIYIIMCTVPKCGVTEFVCPGDSGGTVLHSSGVIGVHSASIRCFQQKNSTIFGKYNYASINVPVSPYLDWIRSEITKD